MDNVLATIESKVSPDAVNAGKTEELKSGHMNYGKELFDMYVGDDAKDTMVKAIIRMAEALTQDQFEKACKDAQGIADNMDTALGFKPAADAKGAEKYGAKRKVINARVSEAKAIFGAYKIDPKIVQEKGYWSALQASRDLLKAKGVKWDGATAPTKEERETKKQNKEFNAAFDAARELLAQLPGESPKDYATRCAAKAEAILADTRIRATCTMLMDQEKTDGEACVLIAVYNYLRSKGAERMAEFATDLANAAKEMAAAEQAKDAPKT